jgi:hypothetical protein
LEERGRPRRPVRQGRGSGEHLDRVLGGHRFPVGHRHRRRGHAQHPVRDRVPFLDRVLEHLHQSRPVPQSSGGGVDLGDRGVDGTNVGRCQVREPHVPDGRHDPAPHRRPGRDVGRRPAPGLDQWEPHVGPRLHRRRRRRPSGPGLEGTDLVAELPLHLRLRLARDHRSATATRAGVAGVDARTHPTPRLPALRHVLTSVVRTVRSVGRVDRPRTPLAPLAHGSVTADRSPNASARSSRAAIGTTNA